MDDKIILTETQLAGLYKDLLINIETDNDQSTAAESSLTIPYKGGYKKKIVWMHNESAHSYINDEDFEMVTKILEACKMNWDDIALVNTANDTIDQHMIAEQLQPEFLINSTGYKNDYNIYQNNDLKILSTHTLSQIRNDKALKIKLWQALKIFFNLQ